MQVTYAKGWFARQRQPLAALDVDTARDLHRRGELYTAILGDPAAPHCYLDVRLERDFVGVNFLDPLRRCDLSYLFTPAGQRLFLSEIWVRHFTGDCDSAPAREHYGFANDGHVNVERYEEGKRIELIQYRDVDVAPHYAAVPEFGEYESLGRRER
jgi:hypothetical protein